MDYKDVLFLLALIIFYVFTFLLYAAIGNTISGQKITKVDHVIHPFAKSFQNQQGTKSEPSFFFALYYLIFFVLVIASISQVMSLRSTFRAWIDRLIGTAPEEEQQQAATSSSASSLHEREQQPSSSKIPVSASQTSMPPSRTTSKRNIKASRSRTPPDRRRKEKIPSVMRASVVDSQHQIIPPLPRLSIKEDTSEKLTRVLNKFESMDLSNDDLTAPPPSKRKND